MHDAHEVITLGLKVVTWLLVFVYFVSLVLEQMKNRRMDQELQNSYILLHVIAFRLVVGVIR